MEEMTVTFQRKGIKANRTMHPVLVEAIVNLGNRARQKRINAITEEDWTLRETMQDEGFKRRTLSTNSCRTNSL